MSFKQISIKYRPTTFKTVDGQSIAVQILTNSILMDRVSKAVLVSGIRGTGKTTIARLYAKALNCEHFKDLGDVCNKCTSCLEAKNGTHPDIIEFDAASNNGVDFVRDLEIVFKQMETFKRRVVIFDEVHMFTPQAQSALLKTLEEPPRNLTFILSTTDPERLTTTIRSRCLSMPLRPLIPSDIEVNIRRILKAEGVEATEDFIKSLSLYGGGSLRDVQQILDQVMLAANGQLLESSYLEFLMGVIPLSLYKSLGPILCAKDIKLALAYVEYWWNSGVDLEQLFIEGIPNLLRDFSIVLSGSWTPSITLLTGLQAEVILEKVKLSMGYIKLISEKWKEHSDMFNGMCTAKTIWTLFFISIFCDQDKPYSFPEY